MSHEAGGGAGGHAGGAAMDGSWPNQLMVVAPHQGQRGPLPHLRRSSSTHLRHPNGAPATDGTASDREVVREPPRLQSRRSNSAERGAWVSAPPTKPKAERWVPLPFPHREAQEEEEEGEVDERAVLLDSAGTIMGLDGQHPEVRGLMREHSDHMSPMHPPGAMLVDPQGVRGRIHVVTACEQYNRDMVWDVLRLAFPGCPLGKHSEVIHLGVSPSALNRSRLSFTAEPQEPGDVFVFDYGVVICWGLDREAEQYMMGVLRPCQSKRIGPEEVQTETLAFHYTADQPPHIQNDCITISRREARDHKVKMAISHALAQSSKLNVYEARVEQLVEQIKLLPESLAVHGEIRMSRQQMAKIKGQLIIRKSEVNLLSTVLDTPDFFWSAPDALRALYDKVAEYCELSSRAVLVNSRTELITTMLRVWSDHKEHHHLAKLDLIVMILIMVEVVLAAAEVVGFFIHAKRHG